MAVFTCGEGYHNYHHAFQHDYRNGVKPWQFDPTKWMIWVLSKLGLTSNLRRVSDAKILLAEMREAKRLIEQKREAVVEVKATPVCEKTEEMIDLLSDRLTNCFSQIDEAIADKVELSKSALREIHTEIRSVVRGISKVKAVAA
jgi:stearoyl-CoA desaturase (delta-9 desaturase)